MAVGFGASAESHTSGTVGSQSQASFTWNHDSTGDRAAVVWVLSLSATPLDSSVTFGGTSMFLVDGSEANDTATEVATVRAYFLDAITQGASTAVVVNRTNNATSMYAVSVTFTANTICQVDGVTIQEENAALAEVAVDDESPGTNSLRTAFGYTGAASPPSAGANSTLLQSFTFSASAAAAVVETTAGQGSRNVGMTAANDDRAYSLLAVRELPPMFLVAARGAR
jgi:hypothetical protein